MTTLIWGVHLKLQLQCDGNICKLFAHRKFVLSTSTNSVNNTFLLSDVVCVDGNSNPAAVPYKCERGGEKVLRFVRCQDRTRRRDIWFTTNPTAKGTDSYIDNICNQRLHAAAATESKHQALRGALLTEHLTPLVPLPSLLNISTRFRKQNESRRAERFM